MDNFAQYVISTNVAEGQVAVFWLGQAGFLFKTHAGKLIAVDPYLSDCCERYHGFKRLMARIMTPYDLRLDYLVISHAHRDHFDVDSVPLLMDNTKTELFCALDCQKECDRLRLSRNVNYMAIGDTAERDNIKITALPCDHGEGTPYALGLLLEIDGKRIYIMGDTAYRPEWLEVEPLCNVKDNTDLLILPINGAFGNLNESQAADIVKRIRPSVAVPCHFWNFAEHGGNPGLFANAMKEVAPELKYVLMRNGEGMVI